MKIYVVARGLKTGFYREWEQMKHLVLGYAGAKHKSFKNIEDAIDFWEKY